MCVGTVTASPRMNGRHLLPIITRKPRRRAPPWRKPPPRVALGNELHINTTNIGKILVHWLKRSSDFDSSSLTRSYVNSSFA